MSFLNESGLSYFWNKVKSFLDSKFDSYTPLTIYKADETRIGTWINGKPIYRRILTGNVGTVSSTTKQLAVGPIGGLDAIIRMYGVLDRKGDSGQHVINENYCGTPSDPFFLSAQAWGQYVYLFVRVPSDTAMTNVMQNSDFWLAVEYTKTTDVATVTTSEFSVSNNALNSTAPVTSGL